MLNAESVTFSAGHETVHLRARLSQFGGLLERESLLRLGRNGETRFTQVVLANEANVQDLQRTEPHEKIRDAIPRMAREPLAASAKKVPLGHDEDVIEMIRHLANAQDEAALLRQLEDVVLRLGARTTFFCLTEKGTDGAHQSYRVLSASGVDLVQKYAEKRWYATDPFMTHGAHSQQPFFSSDVGSIKYLDGSRREMAEFMRSFGASSWITIPAHGPEARFFGVLYVAMPDLPEDGGEEPLRKNRLLFKLIAGEIFDWYDRGERASSWSSSGLTRLELDMLYLSAQGASSAMIAESLGLSANAVTRRHFKSINAKLRTNSITESVRLAAARNLLPIASNRKVAYVLHSPVYGIFLGCDHSVPFWSGVMPSGMDEAAVFADIESAEAALSELGLPHGHDIELKRVDIHQAAQTATINDCLRAGLPAWDPLVQTSGAPADDSATPGEIEEGPPPSYH
ncbi:helix-turn-helix transcriptional regulator [Burkholderia sp. Leaf177]|uniref:helix-turn-helix transcriptional regulator n=1 Tax=Burkholderia sp. Leaf177 TaxID=1736287 RepID=UPI00138F6B30|nr:LuxR family transcriptional regulator [Burkholderia sp. Leaf177]